MSVSSAMEDIMHPEPGCLVSLIGGKGSSGMCTVVLEDADGPTLVSVDWGIIDKSIGKVHKWHFESELVVSETKDHYRERRAAQAAYIVG